MVDWPKLQIVKALRGFLGLAGYYRKFIKDFGKRASSLTNMLKKNFFSWTLLTDEAFVQLQMAMTKAPVLAFLDFSKAFVVECNASGSGIRAILRQEIPIAFIS